MRSPVTVAVMPYKRNMVTRKYRGLDLSSVDVIVGSGCLVPVPEEVCTVDADTPKDPRHRSDRSMYAVYKTIVGRALRDSRSMCVRGFCEAAVMTVVFQAWLCSTEVTVGFRFAKARDDWR